MQLLPFLFVHHPRRSQFHILGFVQSALIFLLGTLLALTPTLYVPEVPGAQPHPVQTAAPLSRLFFVFIEGRMYRYFARTSSLLARVLRLKSESVTFKDLVPPLPDYLHSDQVLSRFRWESDEPAQSADRTRAKREVVIGHGREFVWEYKRDIAEIVAFATGWIAFVFLSPLSMNLVRFGQTLIVRQLRLTTLSYTQLLRYVQQSEAPPLGLSPYLFVLLIFIAPIAQSVCNQAALYRVAQLGLRLRAILGHAIYAKLMRIKAGGTSIKQEEQSDEDGKGGKGGGGGSEAGGRVNSASSRLLDTHRRQVYLQVSASRPRGDRHRYDHLVASDRSSDVRRPAEACRLDHLSIRSPRMVGFRRPRLGAFDVRAPELACPADVPTNTSLPRTADRPIRTRLQPRLEAIRCRTRGDHEGDRPANHARSGTPELDSDSQDVRVGEAQYGTDR